MKNYTHLTAELRYTIDVLLQQKKSRKEICEIINISQSALCRELKRNSGQRGYHCKQAQVKADDRKRRLQNYRHLTIELRKFIRTIITAEQWSPAQIVGYLRKKGEKCVCVETIYAYIRADRAAGGDLWKHCRHQLKHRKRQVTQPYKAVQDSPYDLSECKPYSESDIDLSKAFLFEGKTEEEISLVCPTSDVPSATIDREDGWKGFKINGILDFSMIGVLSRISSVLAVNSIWIFVVSAYNTDYILVKSENFEQASSLLSDAGYKIS